MYLKKVIAFLWFLWLFLENHNNSENNGKKSVGVFVKPLK